MAVRLLATAVEEEEEKVEEEAIHSPRFLSCRSMWRSAAQNAERVSVRGRDARHFLFAAWSLRLGSIHLKCISEHVRNQSECLECALTPLNFFFNFFF